MERLLNNFIRLFVFLIITASHAQFVPQRKVIAVKDAISFHDTKKQYPLLLLYYLRGKSHNDADHEAVKKQARELLHEENFEQSKYNLTPEAHNIIKLAQERVIEINKRLKFRYMVIKSYSDDPAKHVIYFLQDCLPATEQYIPMKYVSNYFKITLKSKADAGIGTHRIIFNQKSKL